MSSVINLSRRRFLQTSGALSAGLLLGFRLDDPAAAAAEGAAVFNPNAWLEITPDGQVTILVPWSELGQGPLTVMPMLLADELEADWDAVTVKMAWNDPRFGNMGTGGSRTVRTSWDPVRRAGATAREMLVAAAAARWGVDAGRCRAEKGQVLHPDGRRLDFGALAADAAGLAAPEAVALKEPDARALIGTSPPRRDIPDKVTGRARFGFDFRLEGMVFAAVAQAPVFRAQAAVVDDAAARRTPGVLDVIRLRRGVAVIATNTWAAFRGRDALQVTWEGGDGELDSAGVAAQLAAADPAQAQVMRGDGDVDGALAAAATTHEAVYELPYLSHSPMEPMNCTARVSGDRCEVWAPIQSVSWGAGVAAQAAGVPAGNVRLQPLLSGGGFGRRLMVDYVEMAVEAAKAVGKPVQVVFTREDDTRHGFYRPASRHTLRGGFDAQGRLTAWSHHVAAPSISYQLDPEGMVYGRDEGAVSGAKDVAYEVPNLQVLYSMVNPPVPVGWLRSVYNTQNALANECFLDELARLQGVDPVELRRDLLPADSRLRGALERAAREWGWPRKLPGGRGQGVACHACFGSYVAMMAEVSLADDRFRVERVLAALDCGPVVHPDNARAQMEGGIAYALSHLLHEEITLAGGGVREGNFDDYPVLRLDEMPQVDVVLIPSEDAIGGIGEPGYPPLGPAVLNALCDATGRRIRRLPLLAALRG